MSTRANYFKLGLFIIASSVLALAVLVFFGLGSLRQDKIMLETYFDESVQGLDVGSPLKFKGVKIGSVERIRFVFNKYHHIKDIPFRYVLVEMALDPQSALAVKNLDELREAIDAEVGSGLRVRIAPQGLTGAGYLEMDYVTTRARNPLPITWTPEYPYVPSSPSTIARLEETFETFSKLLRKVEDAGVDHAIQNINALLAALGDTVKQADVPGMSHNINLLIEDLRKTNDGLNSIMDSKQAKEALKNLGDTLANMKTSTEGLPQAIGELRKLLKEVNALVTSQRDEVQGLLQQGRQVFENLNDLTGEAKRNPSRIIFGAPPVRVNPEKR
jgi:phospholipid/cholesterol/gamma-HCH transport system substrate-binding protein/paraquat-inducible protein B